MPVKGAVTVDVLPIDGRYLTQEKEKLPCKTISVDDRTKGTVFIVFQPDASITADKAYWVRLNGLTCAKVPSKEIGYLVHFQQIEPVVPSKPAGKKK